MANTVVVKNKQGVLFDIPAENIKKATAEGYSIATTQDLEKEAMEKEYGGVTGGIAAAGLGALSSGTFGLGTQALTQSGIVSPETIKAYKEVNPVSYLTGEVGGIVGSSLLAPEFAPVRLAEAARVGLTAKTLSALPEATSLAGKLATRGAAGAVGGAAEGALYGAGQLVNEHALGDPDLNSEKISSTLGRSAVAGGLIGTILGPIEIALAKKGSKYLSETLEDMPIDNAGTMDAALNSSVLTPDQKKGIVAGIKQKKVNAKEIMDAGTDLGAEVLDGATSASKFVQEGESVLLQSRTPIGIARQQVLQKAEETVEGAVKNIVTGKSGLTEVGTGDAIKQSIMNRVETVRKPIEDMYNTLRESTEFIPVSDKAKQVIAANLRKETQKFTVGIEKKIGDAILSNLDNLKTVDDLKRFNTALYKEFPMNKSDVAKFAEKITNLEEASVLRAAEAFAKEAKDPSAKAAILELIDLRKNANTAYKSLMEEVGELSSSLGRKRVKGPGDFIDFVDELDAETVSKKLFTKGKSAALERFSKNFPEEAKLLFDLEKTKILNKAMSGEKFRITSAIKQVEDLSPEVRKIMFSPDELKKLNSAKVWHNAHKDLPRLSGPSGTPGGLEFRNYLGDAFSVGKDIATGAAIGGATAGPVGAVIGGLAGAVGTQKNLIRDIGIQKMLSAAVREGDHSTDLLIQKLSTIEKIIHRTNAQVKTVASGIVRVNARTVDVLPGIGTVLMNKEDKDKKFKKIEKEMDETNNMETYLEKVDKSTASLYSAAPALSTSLQMSMARSTSFLKEKLPKPQKLAALSPEIKPSDAEINKFFRYYDIVENPILVLKQVHAGVLTPEAMETMETVYPAFLQEMRQVLMEKISGTKDADKIPYQTKVMLSAFLDMDLVTGMGQEAIEANQLSFSAISQKSENEETAMMNKKPSQKGLESLTLSERSNTATRSVMERKRS